MWALVVLLMNWLIVTAEPSDWKEKVHIRVRYHKEGSIGSFTLRLFFFFSYIQSDETACVGHSFLKNSFLLLFFAPGIPYLLEIDRL